MPVTPYKYEPIEKEICETDSNNVYLINTTPAPTKQPNTANSIAESTYLLSFSLLVFISNRFF